MTEAKRALLTIGMAVALPFCVGSILAVSTPKAAPVEHVELVSVQECATRAVYYLADQDDYALRALLANAALNHLSAPGVAAPPCSYPSPKDAGGTLNAYQWQAAADAVEAVANGTYAIPHACTGAREVLNAADAPRAQCVVDGFAFVGGTR